MNRTLAFLFLLVSYKGVLAQQSTLPEVSKKVEFAGITVRLDPDAQRLVEREVSTLLFPENKYVMDKLQRIQWYFPIIEHILEQEKVPEDFKYLAVVESSLLPDAISSSNAVGFWQMKASTAQEMGLRVDSDIDERKNIYASTRAAAGYLKRNNLIYKNWISTLYSYMLGAGGISKIVPAEWTNATEIELSGNTDRYLLKTIASRIAFEHRVNRMKEPSLSFIEYRNTKGKTLSQIANMVNVDATELKKYNSWLQTNTIPSDYSVSILVPVERLDEVQSKVGRQTEIAVAKNDKSVAPVNRDYPVLERITKETNNEDDPIFYFINEKKGILAKPGDDVASLARSSKIKIADFLRSNDMSDKDYVEEGKVYYLQRKARKGPVPKHAVVPGQSMWDISQIYAIRLKNLLKLNRLHVAMPLQEGQVVYLQKKRPKNEPLESSFDKPAVPSQPTEKVPMVEAYEEKVVAKETKKKTKTPTPEEVMTTPTETAVIGGTATAEKPKKVETEEEDDIVVIAEEDEPVKTPVTSTRTTPPPVTIKPSVETPKKAPINNNASGIHTVDIGQTLYSIARQYNVSVKDLAAWNSIATDERVKVGQELVVRGKMKAETAPKSSTASASGASTHQVQKGETLFSISKRYSVAMKQIQTWNNMNDQNVKIGQKLIIRKI